MDKATERVPSVGNAGTGSGIDFHLIVLLAFTLVVPFILGSADRIFGDGDVSWHVAAGQWMISHGRVPFTDPFSFSAGGKPWIAHEWLSEVAMGGAYNIAGYAGLSVLVITALAALMLVLARELIRWLRPIETAAVLTVVAVTLVPFLRARPMALSWPVLAFWTVQLMHARERKRAPSLWLALVMLLWVNMHASFALGLLLIGAFALEALLDEADKKRVLVGWGTFGLLCTAVCFLNPNTLTGFLVPLSAFTSSTVNLVQEFRPTDMSFTPGFELLLLVVLAICLGRGAKIPPVRLLVLLGLLHLAFQHMRHQVLFAIVAALLIARPVAESAPTPRTDSKATNPSRLLRFAAIGFVLLLGVRLAQPMTPPDSAINPMSALASVPADLRGQPVLNSYSFGGPLIQRGIRVFIDGRTDLYGDPFVLKYKKMLDGDAGEVARAQRRWNFRWALISTGDKRLLAILDHSPEWRRIRADRYAVTFVRR
jgi:hypothetical protein